ncbi:MAG: hypothetical protein KAJ67_04465 [Gemmatimonadetes bacterium]|nr:hypothetical protein [Gemmatimonadota bacterium]
MKNLAPRFPSRRRRLYPHPALLLAAALAAASCSTAPPRQTAFMSGTENVDLTSMEVRIHAYGYAERFSARVETAADEILAVTEDADVARNALLWKMNALPAMHLAVFQPDPLIGFLDAWTLTVQMGDFFTTGAGRDAFGPLQSIAVEASEALERAVGEVIASVTVSGDAPWGERTVRAWADSHPITSMEFLRETTASEFADVLGQDQAGGMAVLGSLAMQATDLSERLKYYAAAMPKQIRWQSKLVLLELLDEADVEEFLGNVGSIDRSAFRLAEFADTVPALVGDQAAFAVDALSDELLALLREVSRQRLETLEALTAERIAVMEQVGNELIAMMDQVAAIADSTLRRAPVAAAEVVDYAFRRALVLLALIFVGGLIFAFLLRLIWRRP